MRKALLIFFSVAIFFNVKGQELEIQKMINLKSNITHVKDFARLDFYNFSYIKSPDSIKQKYSTFFDESSSTSKQQANSNLFDSLKINLLNWTKDSIQWVAISKDSTMLWLGKSASNDTKWVGIKDSTVLAKIDLKSIYHFKSNAENLIDSSRKNSILDTYKYNTLEWAPVQGDILNSIFGVAEKKSIVQLTSSQIPDVAKMEISGC